MLKEKRSTLYRSKRVNSKESRKDTLKNQKPTLSRIKGITSKESKTKL